MTEFPNGSEAALSLSRKLMTASGWRAELNEGEDQQVLIAVPGQERNNRYQNADSRPLELNVLEHFVDQPLYAGIKSMIHGLTIVLNPVIYRHGA